MGKSDQQAAKQQANQQIQQNQQNEATANQTLTGVLNTAQGTAASVLPGITSGYSNIAASGGGLDPNAQAAYQTLSSGSTVAPDLLATGGISPEQAQAMKAEASGSARSTYQTAAADASRMAAATGGYGDTSALQSQLARQGSEAASKAAVSSDASVAGLEQSGRLAATGLQTSAMGTGASGLAAGQQNVTANQLAALGGSTNIYGMNENQVNTTVTSILQNYQQTGALNNQDLAILTNLANQPGVFDKIVSTIGTLGGAAAGIISAVSPTGLAKTATSGVEGGLYGSGG